ncbi:MAG: RCC1 repeat-containing protein, partial [Polyangiaceae bacterium]|nr:RCC1 repeat-containing protein [Polyangiaceae bacterium]
QNNYHQLGNATLGSAGQSVTPVAVTGITNAKAVAAGGDFACALLADGTVQCWGQLVNTAPNATPVEQTPMPVPGVANATAIAVSTAGNGFACALLQSGAVKCWGDNSAGQLGNGTTTNASTPVSVAW